MIIEAEIGGQWETLLDKSDCAIPAIEPYNFTVEDGGSITADKLRFTFFKGADMSFAGINEIEVRQSAYEGTPDGTLTVPTSEPVTSTNVLSGLKYTTNISEGNGQFQGAHPDAEGVKLTDGIKATNNGGNLDWYNSAYVGLNRNPEIVLTFDELGGAKSIESINMGFIQSIPIAAFVPRTVRIEVKDADGNWTVAGTANYKGEGIEADKVYEESYTFDSPVEAYGLRFSFAADPYNTETFEPMEIKDTGNWGWLFIDEIEAIGTDIA